MNEASQRRSMPTRSIGWYFYRLLLVALPLIVAITVYLKVWADSSSSYRLRWFQCRMWPRMDYSVPMGFSGLVQEYDFDSGTVIMELRYVNGVLREQYVYRRAGQNVDHLKVITPSGYHLFIYEKGHMVFSSPLDPSGEHTNGKVHEWDLEGDSVGGSVQEVEGSSDRSGAGGQQSGEEHAGGGE